MTSGRISRTASGGAIASPGTPAAESYRRLRTMIDVAASEHPGAVLVTSPDAGEGTTTMVANLGVALASAQRPALLIDGNLYRPALHTLFGVSNAVGLSSVASGQFSLAEALQPLPGHPGVSLLTAGPAVDDPAGSLADPAMEGLLAQAARSAKVVFIDGPPLLPVAGGLVLAGWSAGVVMVARAGMTSQPDLSAAVELLQDRGTPIFGVVLTDVPDEGSRRFFKRGSSYADRPARRSGTIVRGTGARAMPPQPPAESRAAPGPVTRAKVAP